MSIRALNEHGSAKHVLILLSTFDTFECKFPFMCLQARLTKYALNGSAV